MDPATAHREVMLILLSIIAAPLIMGASIGIGLAFAAMYETIQRRTSGGSETPYVKVREDATSPKETQITPPSDP